MFKLLVAVAAFPFAFVGAMDLFVFVWAHIDPGVRVDPPTPRFTFCLIAVLWGVFVHSARKDIQRASDQLAYIRSGFGLWLADRRDRLLRRSDYHPNVWWMRRYPGAISALSVAVPPLRPESEAHFKQWKSDMKAQGFGPKGKDPGAVRQ